ncbi:MAG: hypothetical protein KJZ86_13660 [Caldilineaceae bacterium]|nr:hypothetical protein [Caldilineaceae bacterium]HRJ42861.1 hypothetical protein [Caldilineaceae bacterium]
MTSGPTPFAGLRRLPGFARQRFLAYLAEMWDSLRLDLRDLPITYRRLALLGYGLALLLILALFIFDLAESRLPRTEFATSGYQRILHLSVPAGAPSLYLLGWVTGWALLLTGASDCRKRIFLPIALYFTLAWLSGSGLANAEGSEGFLLWLLPLLLLGLRVVSGRLSFWQKRPGLEFLLWAVCLAAYPLSQGIDGQRQAASLYTSLAGVYIVGLPFWFWLGVDGAGGVLQTASGLLASLRQALGGRSDNLAPGLILLLAGAAVGLAFVDRPLWALPVVLLLLAAATLGAARLLGRGRIGARRYLLWLIFSAFVFTLFLDLTVQEIDTDVNSIVLGLAGLPPAFSFGLLLLYDIFTAGSRFAGVDGRWLPRRARVLIYLGVIVLSAAFTFLALNVFDVERSAPHDLVARNIGVVTFGGLVLGGLGLLFVRGRSIWGNESASSSPAPPDSPL